MAGDRRSPTQAGAVEPVVRLDHVLVGHQDLEAACDEIEGLVGVRPGMGGSHPQWGTHNALLALGPACYLEVVAPRPEAPPPATPRQALFAFLKQLDRARPVGWALATDAGERLRRRLATAGLISTEPAVGERRRPDGNRLAWTTFALEGRPMVGALPFFIEWARGSAHPASDSPRGCSLRSLRVLDTEAGELVALCDALGLEAREMQVEIESAAAPGLEVELDTPRGRVVLGG